MKKFEIPKVQFETTNKAIRFPNYLIEEIKKITEDQNCTFSAFVIAAVRFALENIKEKEEQ